MKTTEAELRSNWWTVLSILPYRQGEDDTARKLVRARCNHCKHLVVERKDHFMKRKECPSCGR